MFEVSKLLNAIPIVLSFQTNKYFKHAHFTCVDILLYVKNQEFFDKRKCINTSMKQSKSVINIWFTYIFNSISVLLFIKVIVECSHVGLFEIGLSERERERRVCCHSLNDTKELYIDTQTHRFGLGETSQSLDGFGNESEGS